MICSSYNVLSILFVLIATSPSFLYGYPEDPVAVVLEEPVAIAVDEAAPSVVVAAEPVVVPAVTAVENAVPVLAPSPIQSEQLGGGIITEQKNPDGSIVTVTRYNGPVPTSAFPKMQRNFPSPFFGFGYPFGYPLFGLPAAGNQYYY